MEKKNITKYIIAFGAMILVVAAMITAYTLLKPKATEGSKEIVIEVIVPDEESKEYSIKTDAEYLRGALDEINLVKGTESEYGFMIEEVNGRVADTEKQEWWAIKQDGVLSSYGVNDIAISDGDHYELVLTIGYN